MTDVLLGQSYYLRFDPKLFAAMQPYPPLGTLYAAAYLRAHGHDVALFDAMLAGSEDEWAAALDQHLNEGVNRLNAFQQPGDGSGGGLRAPIGGRRPHRQGLPLSRRVFAGLDHGPAVSPRLAPGEEIRRQRRL